MCSPTWETHILSDICSPTGETHIPSDMCFPTWETHIPSDMCFPYPGTHINSYIGVRININFHCLIFDHKKTSNIYLGESDNFLDKQKKIRKPHLKNLAELLIKEME